jgi:glycosyltransferase involved in cell wall biosynthesis
VDKEGNNKSMKILQLVYESFGSPFGFGGAGVRAYKIYQRLKNRHDITLVCMKYPGAKDGNIEGLKHIFIGTESKNLTKSVFAFTLQTAYFVKKDGNEYDVIVENFLPATPFFSRFLTKTPVILQIQGMMEKHTFKKFNPLHSVPMYLAERLYPKLYDKFLFVSHITLEKVMKSTGKNPKLCKVIHNAADKELFEVTPEEHNYILFFSRLDSYTKGLDILVRAFEKISSRHQGIKLVLAGFEITSFRKLVQHCSSAVRDKIEYVGFVTGDEKVRLLSQAQMYVLPSRHESSPISILEAAACRKPIIVSDIPELRFVQENEIGLTFRSEDHESLAEKMDKLLSDEQLRQKLGEQAREFSRRFHWDRKALLFERLLKEVVESSDVYRK